jgi:hypothetical protein
MTNMPNHFNVDNVDSSCLSVGDHLWAVYSPQTPPMTESQKTWCLVHFVVVEYRVQRGKHLGDWTTGLQDLGWEPISLAEACDLWQQSRGAAA